MAPAPLTPSPFRFKPPSAFRCDHPSAHSHFNTHKLNAVSTPATRSDPKSRSGERTPLTQTARAQQLGRDDGGLGRGVKATKAVKGELGDGFEVLGDQKSAEWSGSAVVNAQRNEEEVVMGSAHAQRSLRLQHHERGGVLHQRNNKAYGAAHDDETGEEQYRSLGSPRKRRRMSPQFYEHGNLSSSCSPRSAQPSTPLTSARANLGYLRHSFLRNIPTPSRPQPPLFNATPTFTLHTPNAFNIPSSLAVSTTATPNTALKRPRFMLPAPPRPETAKMAPALLPNAFSPHRRKERFVPNGWSAQLRSWIVDAFAGGVADSGIRGDEEASARRCDVVLRIQQSRAGDGMVLMRGLVEDSEEGIWVNALLVGEDGAGSGVSSGSVIGLDSDAREDRVREGIEIKVGVPAWTVKLDIDSAAAESERAASTWVICPSWKIC